MRNALDVNAARSHVRSYEHAIIALLKSAQRVVALALTSVAVNGGCVYAAAN